MADRIVTELIVKGAQQFVSDFTTANVAVQSLTTRLEQAERIRTPQLGPQIEQVSQAFQKAARSGAEYVNSLAQIQSSATQVTQAEKQKASAINEEDDAQKRTKSSGITYLSTLSAIHAASFLLSNRTFTLVGSFFTLGAAFSKLGGGAVALGAAFGGVLFVIGQIGQAVTQIQQAFITVTQAVATGALAIGAAVATAGVASVSIAANVESQLAGLRAFGQATAEQLGKASEQATQLAIRFGVSSKAIVEATSLFARAGGTVQEALDGATEAVIKLQVASQGEISAANAAIAVSAGLKQFALAGSEAARVADVLTGAAQASALSFSGVVQAFIQAAPGARTLGVSIEDLGATIALLGNDLIKGTITGTSFKQFILDLVNPSAQAAAVLNKFGVSIQDSAGNIRPLIDVLADLNKALGDEAVDLGRVTAAERARALAAIFGSRAALAANVLTREGAAGLVKFREATERVTATNIVDVLLLPLNRQLEILKVTIEETGRAFGGPFLEPIRTATVAAISFFKGLIEPARLAGQILAVALSGQGFGALREQIVALAGETKLAQFLIELANSFRNIVDVIQGPVASGINQFISILSGAANAGTTVEGISKAFDSVNRSVQFAGAVFFVTSKKLAEFIVEIVKGEGAGGRFKDAVINIATAIVTQFVVSLATGTAALIFAIKLMDQFGKAIRGLATPLVGVARSFIAFGDAIRQTVENVVKFAVTAFQTLQGNIGPGAAADIDKTTKNILDTMNSIGGAVQGANPATAILRNLAEAVASIGDAADVLDLDKTIDEANKSARGALQTFHDLAGSIPDELSNLRAEFDEVIRKAPGGPTGTQGAPAPDTKAIENATKKILEFRSDLARKLKNLDEDTATKAEQIATKSAERIIDINEKANQNLARLERDHQQRIADLRENFQLNRAQQRFNTDLQRQLDVRSRNFQRALDREELASSRTLDNIRTARQRATEDATRDFDLQVSAAERAFSRIQQDAETAFGRVQSARERAFSKQQDLEQRALSAQLDAEATRRQNAIELANARPEERSNILARQAQAAQDRAFQLSQQRQLDALRDRQEQARVAFQQQQEQAQTAFRRSQENSLLQFRLDADKVALGRRRQLEDTETQIRRNEEDQQLVERLAREDRLVQFRINNENEVNKIREAFDRDALNRSIQRATRERDDRRSDIITERNRQIGEVFDQLNLQFNDLQINQDKTLRGIQDSFDDLVENLDPATRGALGGQIAAVQQLINSGVENAAANLETVRQKALAVVEASRIIGEARVGLGASLGANAGAALTPANVQQPVYQAFIAGFRQASAEGLLTQNVTVVVNGNSAAGGLTLDEIIRSAR